MGKNLVAEVRSPWFYSSLWVSHLRNEETGRERILDFTGLPQSVLGLVIK